MSARRPSDDQTPRNGEALCRKCGACCYEKVYISGEVFSTTRPCAHLDTTRLLCKVYGRRFESNPNCLGVEEGVRRRVFPADCPYVRNRPAYRPPRPEVLGPTIFRMLRDGEIVSMEELYEAVRRHPAELDTPP